MTDVRFERVCDTVRREMDRLPIPGVALGILYEGEEQSAGMGVTSVETRVPVTPQTLYQIGSITKTFLGTLVMRLVEMGEVELDAPIKHYLPDLKLQDADAMERATLFHCLTHTGGWLGDYFDDLGRGDDALARIVASMAQLPQLTPLGAVWSYNNAGFYLAGRVVEVVTGKPFESAMQELIFDPLGLENSYFFAEDVISRAFAVGHEKQSDNTITVARPWALSRSAHPPGGILSNIPDLLAYARFHMGDGSLPDGTRILSQQSLTEMQTPYFPSTDPQSVGLTWYMRDVNGAKMFGHNGGTNGQLTVLQICPARKLAFAVLTNGDLGMTLTNNVTASILQHYLGIAPTVNVPIPMSAAELEPYVGRYEAPLDDAVLSVRDGELILQLTDKGGFPAKSSPPPGSQPPPVRAAFYAYDKLFVQEDPYKDARGQFLRDPGGEIRWLRFSGRIHKKIA